MLRYYFLFLFFCSADSFSFSQSPIDSFVDVLGSSLIKNPAHVGLSIGVYQKGKSHYFNYGTIQKGKTIAPSDSTIYEIASITKTFTAYLLAKAVLEGRVNLKEDIRLYLPGRYPNLEYMGHAITIEDLATHTSGLPKNLPNYNLQLTGPELIEQYPLISKAQFLSALAEFKPDTIPGTKFAYSNADAQLIGLILEKMYKANYAELLSKYITEPLGMKDSKLTMTSKDHQRMAIGYNDKGEKMPELSFWRDLPAAGYIKSSIGDMLKYLRFCMSENNPIVQLAEHPIFHQTKEQGADIGLFWFVQKQTEGYTEILHAGGSFGSTSFCLLIPEYKIAVICFANDAGSGTEQELTLIAKKIGENLVLMKQ